MGFMIARQSPRCQWKPNAAGVARTIDQAIEIAKSNGVNIPDGVAFFIDEDGDLDPDTTARGPKITKCERESVLWSELPRWGGGGGGGGG